MKKYIWVLLVLAMGLLLHGCQQPGGRPAVEFPAEPVLTREKLVWDEDEASAQEMFAVYQAAGSRRAASGEIAGWAMSEQVLVCWKR